MLPYCYEKLSSVLDHFSSGLNIFTLDVAEVSRAADEFLQELESDRKANLQNHSVLFLPEITTVLHRFDQLPWPPDSRYLYFSNLSFLDDEGGAEERISYSSLPLTEFSLLAQNLTPGSDAWLASAQPRLQAWLDAENKIFVAAKNQMQVDRLKALFTKMNIPVQIAGADDCSWAHWAEETQTVTLIPRTFPETCFFVDEKLIFLRSDDFFGKKQRAVSQNAYEQFSAKAKSLAFGDLKPNDLVVHVKHGIGVYEGLKIMNIGGADSEYIQVAYKDKDKL